MLSAGYRSYSDNGSRHVHPAHFHDGTSHSAAKPPVTGQHGHGNVTPARAHRLSSQDSVCIVNVCVYFQYIPANTAMQGTYIPQFTPVPPSSVPEVGSTQFSRAQKIRQWSKKPSFFLGERWSTAAGRHGDACRTHKLHIPTHKVNLR